MYTETISQFIYRRISKFLPHMYSSLMRTDLTAGGTCWSRTRINPLFRFIKYGLGDWLVPHYDDSYRASDDERSLLTVVIYLTAGKTRFIRENRAIHNYEDQDEKPSDDRVINEFLCSPGDILIFDHRILHDCEMLLDNTDEKLIIRTDMMYERPQLGRALSVQPS